VTIARNANHSNNYFSSKNNFSNVIYVIVAFVTGIIPAIIVKLFLPFPFFGFGYMLPALIFQPALRIIKHGYIMLECRWPEIILTAIACNIANCDPCSLNWTLAFVLSSMYSIGLYFLAKELTGKRSIAIIASSVGVFLNIGSHYRTLFFDQFISNPRSNTILYGFLPFILAYVNSELSSKNYKFRDAFISMILITSCFISMYVVLDSDLFRPENFGLPLGYRQYVIKPIIMPLIPLVGIFLSYMLKNKFSREQTLKIFMIMWFFEIFHREESLLFIATILIFVVLKVFLATSIPVSFVISRKKYLLQLNFVVIRILLAFLAIILVFQWFGIISVAHFIAFSSLLYPSLSISAGVQVFKNKCYWFLNANSPLIISLLLIGSSRMFVSNKREHLLTLSMFTITLFIYFLPDYWTYREYKQFSPFMAIIIANAFYDPFYKIVTTRVLIKRPQINTKLMFKRVFPIFCMYILLLPSLILPLYSRFSYTPPGSNIHSLIAEYEYITAMWIRENFPENTKIISDFMTMVLITPLADKIWLIDKKMAVELLNYREKQLLLQIKYGIFLANDSKTAYENILTVANYTPWFEQYYLKQTGLSGNTSTILIVISARTVKWLEQESLKEVRYPQYQDVDFKYLKIFLDDRYFTLVFKIDRKIYVFLVK